jgi:hypothetical protein
MLPPGNLSAPAQQRRFREEAETLAALLHPCILPVYVVGEQDGMPYFTMPLMAGGSLAERKTRYHRQSWAVAQLLAKLADALQYAHERGVLHRDLKPANILFDEFDEPCVADFGLAKLTTSSGNGDSITHSAQLLGTPAYLAPEIAGGSMKAATTASDIYALGAILYELLAGHPPYQAESVQALLRKIVEATQRPAFAAELRVPPDLQAIAQRCLEKEPGRRYPSAASLAQDLRLWLAGRPVAARPLNWADRTRRWAQRHPAVAGLSATLVVGTAVAAALQWRTNVSLRESLTVARQERQEAEGLVAFLNGDLTNRLDEVGRLDLLQDVGRRTEEYFTSRKQRLGDAGDASLATLQARFFTNQARVAFQQGRLTQSAEAAAAALNFHAQLPAPALAEAKTWQGRVWLEQGKFTLAIDALRTAAEDAIAGALTPQTTTTQRELRGAILVHLGNALTTRKLAPEIRAVAQQLAETSTLPAGAGPPSALLRFRQAQYYYLLGYAASAEQDWPKTTAAYEQYHTAVAALAAAEPDNMQWQTALMESWNLTGGSLKGGGQRGEALAHYRKYQALALQLTQRDPTNTAWRRELGLSQWCLASVLTAPEEQAEALQQYENFAATFTPTLRKAVARTSELALYEQAHAWAASQLLTAREQLPARIKALQEAAWASQQLAGLVPDREEYFATVSKHTYGIAWYQWQQQPANPQPGLTTFAQALAWVRNLPTTAIQAEGQASLLARQAAWGQNIQPPQPSVTLLEAALEQRQLAQRLEPDNPTRAAACAKTIWWLALAEASRPDHQPPQVEAKFRQRWQQQCTGPQILAAAREGLEVRRTQPILPVETALVAALADIGTADPALWQQVQDLLAARAKL